VALVSNVDFDPIDCDAVKVSVTASFINPFDGTVNLAVNNAYSFAEYAGMVQRTSKMNDGREVYVWNENWTLHYNNKAVK